MITIEEAKEILQKDHLNAVIGGGDYDEKYDSYKFFITGKVNDKGERLRLSNDTIYLVNVQNGSVIEKYFWDYLEEN